MKQPGQVLGSKATGQAISCAGTHQLPTNPGRLSGGSHLLSAAGSSQQIWALFPEVSSSQQHHGAHQELPQVTAAHTDRDRKRKRQEKDINWEAVRKQVIPRNCASSKLQLCNPLPDHNLTPTLLFTQQLALADAKRNEV